ncbi:MAG: hypothetical protein IPP91_04270 [Betaproteobacteria bacterium]|nr:hypothetical protein [Betaproteobacteria bacterium]
MPPPSSSSLPAGSPSSWDWEAGLALAVTSLAALVLAFATVRGLRDGMLLAPEPVAAIHPVSA